MKLNLKNHNPKHNFLFNIKRLIVLKLIKPIVNKKKFF
jgi:hypothetical protein